MSTPNNQGLRAAVAVPKRTRPYAGPGTVRLLAGAVLLAGVALVPSSGSAYAGRRSHAGEGRGQGAGDPVAAGGVEFAVPLPRADLPPGSPLETAPYRLGASGRRHDGGRAGWRPGVTCCWFGLAAGVGGVLLRRLLFSIADGRPVPAGQRRRIAVVAVQVAPVATLGPPLPQLAGLMVLERLGLAGPVSPFGRAVRRRGVLRPAAAAGHAGAAGAGRGVAGAAPSWPTTSARCVCVPEEEEDDAGGRVVLPASTRPLRPGAGGITR